MLLENKSDVHMQASQWAAMAGSMQFLDITVNDGQHEQGVSRILKFVKPQWDLNKVCQRPLVGGYVNAMYCCFMAEDRGRNDAVIVRIYRDILGEAVDRDKEFLSIQVAQAAGCHAPIYAVFNNGLVYKYVPGRLPSLRDLMKPKVIQEVAKALCRLHEADLASEDLFNRRGNEDLYDQKVDEYSRLKIFADAIPTMPNDPYLEETFQSYRADFPNDVLYQELDFVVSILRQARLPLSFIHGDIHKNNMVLDSSGQVMLFDFEISSIGYRYFDLGFFFVLWRVSPWLDLCQPGDAPLTPEVRRQYLEAYLDAKCEYKGRERKDVSPEEWELMDLQHQVIEFAAMFDITIETLMYVNQPKSVPPKFMYYHPEARDSYFKLKSTIKDVIARIVELDKVVNGPC